MSHKPSRIPAIRIYTYARFLRNDVEDACAAEHRELEQTSTLERVGEAEAYQHHI